MIYEKSSITFRAKPNRPLFNDLEGVQFGYLTVLGLADVHPKRTFWYCECVCGSIIKVRGDSLMRGSATKCHTHFKLPTYRIWKAMKKRCSNTATADWENYGGRGIKVCERWLNSFEHFLVDMGERPSPRHSIDRIDNDGDYCPENCEWRTRKYQNNNQRANHRITFQGKTQSLAMWCDELHLSYHKIKKRLYRGWDITKAFQTP